MSKDDGGLKSAYELAMERLAAKEGAGEPLTEEQKAEIAEIEQKAKAKVAELEIMREQDLAAARASGDAEKIAAAETAKRDEINKIKANAEQEKEQIRTRRA